MNKNDVVFTNLLLLSCTCAMALLVPVSSACSAQDHAQVRSPDGRLEVTIRGDDQGRIVYSVVRDDRPLIEESRLGLLLSNSAKKVFMLGAQSSEHNETWQPVWGKRKQVVDSFRAVDLQLGMSKSAPSRDVSYTISLRVYDDGIAFRYRLPADLEEGGETEIVQDLTEVRFAHDATCWSYAGENPNIGPEKVSEIDGERQYPLLAQCDDDCFVAIHEAALYAAPWMTLKSSAKDRSLRVSTSKYDASASFETPWRALFVGDTPGELLDSDLLLNLNPPTRVADTSWIKPGVCFWDWRAWGHQADGFTYELNLASWKRFVDFAQETGVPYLLLDANWYGPEFEKESNPTETGKVNAVRELLDYANARDVGVLLYLNDVAGRKYDLEAVLKNYHDWGAVGIKYGFMSGSGKSKVDRTRRIIELCAKNQLAVDFHDGPIPPSGDMRTWPNCLTREYCHAQSDSKRAFTPATFVTHAYVNGLAGPLDMANGMFDLKNSMKQRPRVFEEVPSTIVAETARSLIVFTGLNVLPDSADSYRKHRELFEFIAAQKMPWDESRTLQGELGKYIVTMRQTGDTFLVGSATNEEARQLRIPLDFLPAGEFEATLYEDAPDAHYRENREAYTIRRQTCTSATVINAKLAAGGGHAIRLKPLAK